MAKNPKTNKNEDPGNNSGPQKGYSGTGDRGDQGNNVRRPSEANAQPDRVDEVKNR